MAYANHWRFSFGGKIDSISAADQLEVWECTINCTGLVTDPDQILTDVATPMSTWFSAVASKNNNYASLGYLKLNEIGPAGTYVDPAHPHTHVYGTLILGASASSLPSDDTLVYSWTTSRLRGAGSHGRIYPPNAWALTGPSVVSTAVQDAACLAAKNLLNAIVTTSTGGALIPCVSSKVDASNTPITGVRVGRVMDVQRRRRNKVPEAYRTAVWP